ncbi:MAG: hypothetical protein WCH35_10025 [Comamonadaceae bacterium]
MGHACVALVCGPPLPKRIANYGLTPAAFGKSPKLKGKDQMCSGTIGVLDID